MPCPPCVCFITSKASSKKKKFLKKKEKEKLAREAGGTLAACVVRRSSSFQVYRIQPFRCLLAETNDTLVVPPRIVRQNAVGSTRLTVACTAARWSTVSFHLLKSTWHFAAPVQSGWSVCPFDA